MSQENDKNNVNTDDMLKSGQFDGDAVAPEQASTTEAPEVVEPEVEVVAPEANTAELAQQVAALQASVDEKQDQLLRLKADLDNQRRRTTKQVEDAHKFAAQKFVEGILPVIDSLEMGMQAEGDLEQIRQGMDLTLKQFESVMERFKIEAVNPVNEPFNPELHQAMSMQASPDHDNNTVMAVMQKGYTLNGRVVRPAMVMVCKK